MNGTIFMILLSVCAIATGLVTEVEKKLVSDFPTNIIAIITGIVVGGVICAIYYMFNDIAYTDKNIVYMIMICIGSGFGSMIGYDKVTQSIQQIINKLSSK